MVPGAHDRYRIVRARRHGHVTDEVVSALEDEVSSATRWRIVPACGELLQKSARAAVAASMPFPIKKDRDLFMVMMGPHRIPLNAADWLATGGKRVAWVFDVWPSSYDELATNAGKYRIDALFITAKQSADRMARAIDSCEVKWCAEPLVDLGFQPKPWSYRKTDVLQFGRKYEPYHSRMIADLPGTRIKYVFEPSPGQVIWPTKTEFVVGLGDAKVSVCFPCDLTHPERAGDVSTVTQRYFQSFASGCVVVGGTPAELETLFGYDPVVAADLDNPVTQIAEILENPDKYTALVERNLKEVRSHTTAERMACIVRDLA